VSSNAEIDPQVLIVFVTVPNVHVGAHLARVLVQERLAACVNLVPTIRSIYVWEGELHEQDEAMCLIKTQLALFDPLKARLLELHPYQVPEILGVQPARGNEPYLRWINEATTRPAP
jgi:periplasmic divalent cation tolerance protein